MGTLQLRAEFFDVLLDLAVEFRLPIRLSGESSQRNIGFPFRTLATNEGVLFPDHFVNIPGGVGSRPVIDKVLRDLRPGVTEVLLHPAIDTPELRTLAPDWQARVDDHQYVVHDGTVRSILDDEAVHLIGYRALRDLQRAA
jgi:hypothetical protein